MSGWYEDHPEAYHEYQVPHERATMAPERTPASAWKAELEKTDRKFVLSHIMDQFKKFLPRPVARSPSPGGQAGTEDCYYCEKRGHFKRECPKFRVKQNCNGSIKLQRDYSGGRSESLQMKLVISVVESVPQAREAEVAILGHGVGANLPRDREGNGKSTCRVSVEVRAEIESEQCSNSDREATPSGGLDRYLLKSLANILRHGALELGHRLLPGGYLLMAEILKKHLGFAGYSLPDIHKLIKVDVDRSFTLIKDTDSGCWKIRANQGIPWWGYPRHTISKEMNYLCNEVAAPTDTTLASDEEAQESWDSTSEGVTDTTLVEEASDEETVCQ
ncbi:TRPT1 [Mytilus coruscus]|uniref:2'-phosphotransferase n=1 Tax=Mytilus coruscus TaxID=42192 RepID=A0A6J8EYS1_MYTCO|nr:TRPT1 [Mytilus coruscus]